MNIRKAMEMEILAYSLAHAPVVRHHAVTTKKLRSGPNQALSLSPGLIADASASDLANHHSMDEPSASDVQMLHWRTKRVFERIRKRNMDPYEMLRAEKETGPCGCTLQLGDRVTVDGVGRGKIKSRNERMLTVALDNGTSRTIDQKFVHRML